MATIPNLKQLQGCMAGLLIGDCFGFPYEVLPFKQVFPHTLEFIQDDFEAVKGWELKLYDRDSGREDKTLGDGRDIDNSRKATGQLPQMAPLESSDSNSEGSSTEGLSLSSHFSRVKAQQGIDLTTVRQYTDDTSMSISFATFLLLSSGTAFDYTSLARR